MSGKTILALTLAILLIVCLVGTVALASEKEGKDKESAESAWRFPGWEAVFAVLAVALYGSAIKFLPKFISDKKEEEH